MTLMSLFGPTDEDIDSLVGWTSSDPSPKTAKGFPKTTGTVTTDSVTTPLCQSVAGRNQQTRNPEGCRIMHDAVRGCL